LKRRDPDRTARPQAIDLDAVTAIKKIACSADKQRAWRNTARDRKAASDILREPNAKR
jgi:hypothetical protein